jgi:hypothetical protein
VVISYRRFEQPIDSIFKGQEMESGFPETSVRNYHYSLRNSPEELSSSLLRGRILKSCGVRAIQTKSDTILQMRAEVFYIGLSLSHGTDAVNFIEAEDVPV